ncbi:MAG: class I SAM-dependent RNA methyltransferase [Sphingomonadaceae bacterium]|nr:class I SAM-dependent RNA methyltransferase [Sphingomonadaceae bacterium]
METIVRLAARGDGVTESGRYVAGAVPGDTVDGDVIAPGPYHIAPACSHFGVCGGCQSQHADDAVLAGFVSGRILGALAGVGIVPETVYPAHLSPPGARRRASFRLVRDGGGVRLGFNAEGSSAVVDLAECPVVRPALWDAARTLRDALAPRLRTGHAVGMTLTETVSGFDVLLTNLALPAADVGAFAALASQAGLARIATETAAGVEIALQLAEPAVRFDGVAVALPPGGFLQATVDGEAALQAAVLEGVAGAGTVADLFCGAGTFALPLSARTKVFAADAARDAVAGLSAAAKRAGRPVTTAHRDLFRQPLQPAELDKFDAVVLDPPRAGAKTQVETITRSKLKRVVHVSCNPNTFARDAKILHEAGFRLTELWPVGQFRWSVHVELAAVFLR